jgi:hypothetical protein
MYGVFGIWKMAPAHRAEQLRGLEEMVIPLVRRAPGFVAGYWTHDDTRARSYSLVLFDSREQAQGFLSVPQDKPELGIERELLTVVNVDGHDIADRVGLER